MQKYNFIFFIFILEMTHLQASNLLKIGLKMKTTNVNNAQNKESSKDVSEALNRSLVSEHNSWLDRNIEKNFENVLTVLTRQDHCFDDFYPELYQKKNRSAIL